MKKTLLVYALISSASASNADSGTCNALLNVGLYNTSISSSAADAQSLAKSTFCSAKYDSTASSQNAQISASYGLFSGNGGGTKDEITTKQSQICTSGFDSSAYSNKASNYSQNLYQGALDAWNKCQEIAARGLEFSVQPSSTMQGITVLITAKAGFSATYYGVEQFGSGSSNCITRAKGETTNPSASKPFEFTGAEKVTVTCKRKIAKNGADLSADAQDLVFVTSADSLTVPLAAIGSFSRVTAEKIRNDVLKSVNAEFYGSVAAFNAKSCPAGWKPADGSNGTIDLRGEFIRGWDIDRGVDRGRKIGSHQGHQLQRHTHRIQDGVVQNIEIAPHAGTNVFGPTNGPGATVNNFPNTTSVLDADSGQETRPRNLALLYCMKI